MILNSALLSVLILFGTAVAVISLSHRLRIPPVIGFLVTGMAAGPFGFGIIHQQSQVETYAELGVVFLLFLGMTLISLFKALAAGFEIAAAVASLTQLLCLVLSLRYSSHNRSGRNIFDELMYAKEKYGSNEFKVLDDNFTLQMDRAKDICKLFLDEKLDMKWTCPNGIRADRLDEELCTLMKQAGCYSMSIGVESGDPDVFDKINKGERLDDVERGIKLAQAAGIKVHGFFIIGLLGSTYEADKRSMEFAKRLGITASWGILVPYPGTEVWEQIKKDHKTRILRDWKEGFHVGARPKPVFDTSDYTAEERVRAYYYANMSSIKKKDIPRAAKMIIKGLISGK